MGGGKHVRDERRMRLHKETNTIARERKRAFVILCT